MDLEVGGEGELDRPVRAGPEAGRGVHRGPDRAQVVLVEEVIDVDPRLDLLERSGREAVAQVEIGVPDRVLAGLFGIGEVGVAVLPPPLELGLDVAGVYPRA